MLKPRSMSRLFIAASKEQMEPIIQELYRHGVFHIEEHRYVMQRWTGKKVLPMQSLKRIT